MAVLSALLAVLGGAIAGPIGLALCAAFAVALSVTGWRFAAQIALRAGGARPCGEREHPALHAAVRELARRAGVPTPSLWVIPSAQPNAFATGRGPRRAAIAVTDGLLRYLPADQLRAVLAHELAHIRNGDVLVASIAAMPAGLLGMAAGRLRRDGSPSARMVAALLAPLAAALMPPGASRRREYLADADGARLVGDARPLIAALQTLERGTEAIPVRVDAATASLYIASPLPRCGRLRTHPSFDERIRRLRRLRPA
jgi:heat shock protein HtpX